MWSLTISTCTRPQSIVTIKYDLASSFNYFWNFHFHPNNFVCYYAIKWSIFHLKRQILHGRNIEFDGNNIGILCFAIPPFGSVLGVFKNLPPILGRFYAKQFTQGQHQNDSWFLIDDPSIIHTWGSNISTGPYNWNQFRGSTKRPKHCCYSKFTDFFIVARTACLALINHQPILRGPSSIAIKEV